VKVRASELHRLGIRPIQGPGRDGGAEVSLIVSVFLRGETLGESLAAGPENWRTSVYGSPQVRTLSAVYFPQLAEGDLRVTAGDLPAFLQECALLSEHLDAIAGGVDLSAQKGIAVNMATGTMTAIFHYRQQPAKRLKLMSLTRYGRPQRDDSGDRVWRASPGHRR
jgi:hypothetical protein